MMFRLVALSWMDEPEGAMTRVSALPETDVEARLGAPMTCNSMPPMLKSTDVLMDSVLYVACACVVRGSAKRNAAKTMSTRGLVYVCVFMSVRYASC